MSNGGSYDPHAVEGKIYEFWEKGGYFHAAPDPNRRPYVIDIPLPNVTGALHLGHALNNTMQDILIRHKRMCGYEALWMPGTDHAGIATQAVVERRLKQEQNLTRHELGRAGLVQKIWEWKEKYGEQILRQLRKMGFSCDWARTRFTLDEVCAKAVYEVFFQWFKAGLIYRGTRLVNWDAFLQTAVADDEIVHETVKGHLWHYRYPVLPVAADVPVGRSVPDDAISAVLARAAAPEAQLGRDYLTIATTRPETMLGDTAIAVHPDDERYQHLIGRRCLLPLMNRPIPIIADAILVKKEFGTGCVKVTPGHDPNDYAFAQRHGVEMINILTPDGKINENGRGRPGAMAASHASSTEGTGPDRGAAAEGGDVAGSHATHVYDYVGLDRYAARKKVVEDLEKLGLMEKIEPYETEVGHSDRSKTPIEPMLSEQWFVKMGDLAEAAMEAVRDGRVRFFPERYAKTYLDWLGEKRDWCISRQLWWGHRIPVWSFKLSYDARMAWLDASDRMPARDRAALDLCERLANLAPERFCHHLETTEAPKTGQPTLDYASGQMTIAGGTVVWAAPPILPEMTLHACPRDGDPTFIAELEQVGFVQDPDVLDTWFSSALWPFSTLGWPHGEQAMRQQGNKATRQEDEEARAAGTPPASMPRCLDALLPSPADFDYFFPTSVLVTGRGIITLWVARMVMTSLYFTGRVPFQHVHIHPIILDGQGRIMSKSLGNGVDPLDIIELYGTDALRFTMAQMDTETQDVRMPVKPVKIPGGVGVSPAMDKGGAGVSPGRVGVSPAMDKGGAGVSPASERTVNSSEKFELGRNFCNKIWQAATGFVLPNLEGTKGSRDQGLKGGTAVSAVSDRSTTSRAGSSAGRPSPAASDSEVRRYYDPRPLTAKDLALEDHWILSRLAACIGECDRRLEHYQISEVANTLYTFFWSDFCDWYVELVKPRLYAEPTSGGGPTSGRSRQGADARDEQAEVHRPEADRPKADRPEVGPTGSAQVARQVLAWVLDQSLRLLHPIVPFLTEALWQKLNAAAPRRGINKLIDDEPALIKAAWPDANAWPRSPDIEAELEALQNVIRGLRDTLAWINTTRAAAKTPAIGKLPRAVIRAVGPLAAGLQEQAAVICRLGRCETLEIGADVAKPPEVATKVFPGIEVFVPIAGLADLAIERKRLTKDRDHLGEQIKRLEEKLASSDFVARAPPAVVERERSRLGELRDKLAALEHHLNEIGG